MLNRRPFLFSLATQPTHNGSSVLTFWTWTGLVGTVALLLGGCTPGERTFGKINGQIVTEKEYIQQLERQSVAVPGGQPTNAERVVIDQLVTNRTVLSEASKNGVLPSEEEVNTMYETQKSLYKANAPGKDYDTTLKETGVTPDEQKSDIRVQLAETALYAKLLKLDESEVRSTYDKFKTNFGLPARVQLRVVVAAQKAPEFAKAQSELAAGKVFEEVAKEINPLPMRANGGLLPQTIPLEKFPPALQSKISETAEGKYFGPVDFQQQGVKAWLKIEKRLPEYKIPYENAAPLVRRQLVQIKLSDPTNQAIRNEILQKKMQATFDTTDKSYTAVWDAVKDAAAKAGVGQNNAPVSVPAPVSAAPAGNK